MSLIEQPHSLDIKSLTEALIHHFNLHEGVYQLNVKFKIGVGGFAMDGASGSLPLPGAAVGVEAVALIRVPEDANVPNCVDASVVNPSPKAKPRARAKKINS